MLSNLKKLIKFKFALFIKRVLSFFPSRRILISDEIAITSKRKEIKPINPAKQALVPLPGNAWNPIRKYPRNEPCWCNSGRKAKKCCLPMEPLAIDQNAAAKVKPIIKAARDLRG